MKIHHVGYLVKHFDEAYAVFSDLGFRPDGPVTLDESRNIRIQFMSKDGVVIELVSPVSKDSAVGSLLKKTGASPYHICYESEDFQQDMESLEQKGYLRITEPAPAPAIEGNNVVFLVNPEIGLIEIVDKQKA